MNHPRSNSSNLFTRIAVSYRDPRSLKVYARNPRIHPHSQIKRLARNIAEFGFLTPVLIDRDSVIVAGHARVETALQLDLPEIPVVQIEHLTPAEIRLLRLADNKLAEAAKWDLDLLRIELGELMVDVTEVDVTLSGFEIGEIDHLMIEPSDDSGLDEPVPVGETAITQPGDLWLLDDHKVLCGNALEPETYDRLLGDERVDMLLTDPPYNDQIADLVGLGRKAHREFAMASGEMSREEFTRFLRTSTTHAKQHSREGACHFIFMDWRHLPELLDAGRAVYGERLQNMAVWVKTNGGMGSLYRSRHELILIYKCGDAPHVNNVQLGRFGRYRSNVWVHPGCNSFGPTRDEGLEDHPTAKPVALLRDAILDVTNPHDVVLDCFSGSGSTLIAAHKAQRRARLIEFDPLYVDVTIRRWQRITSQDAILATTGETFASVAVRRQSESKNAGEARSPLEEDGALFGPSTPTLKGGVS